MLFGIKPYYLFRRSVIIKKNTVLIIIKQTWDIINVPTTFGAQSVTAQIIRLIGPRSAKKIDRKSSK